MRVGRAPPVLQEEGAGERCEKGTERGGFSFTPVVDPTGWHCSMLSSPPAPTCLNALSLMQNASLTDCHTWQAHMLTTFVKHTVKRTFCKRCRTGAFPLLSNLPCFLLIRPRDKVNRPQTRRRRDNPEECIEKLRQMQENIRAALAIVCEIIRRERRKRDLMHTEVRAGERTGVWEELVAG